MTNRIFRSICLVALTVFLASVLLIMTVLYNYFSNVQQAQLKMQIDLCAQGISHEGMGFFTDLEVKNYRITWIDSDGTVLYDSQSDTAGMENHLEREEVQEAVSTGYGESSRYSSTLMERSLYSARALSDGTILRLSISQNSIFHLFLGMAQRICVIFVIALILSVLLAIRVSKKIVKPLNTLNLDQPLSNEGYDELSPLLTRIDHQQKQLSRQKSELLQKENQLNTIVGSMNEGMVLLNSKGKIISINPAAEGLLEAQSDYVGKDLLAITRNLELQEILSKALGGHPGEKIIKLHEESYQIDAEPITSGGDTKGVVLFFFNVTEKEKAEQMRREFTANVSHELKTPLHSISGYAELLKNGMVEKEAVAPFAGKIYSEAQRMARLVQDIISLSHLDEGAEDMHRETVDMYDLAEKAVQSLEPEAAGAGVTLKLSGEPAHITGVPHLLYSIVYNLCDNAIKYNRKDGSVNIAVKNTETEVLLTVKDTGIGIPPEHKERVFERFYRVDKSHSKEVGGTGLGLSIVKHGVKVHNGKIAMESTPGQGTAITVFFPKSTEKQAVAFAE